MAAKALPMQLPARLSRCRLIFIAFLSAIAWTGPGLSVAQAHFDVLLFTKTAGFRHDSIPAAITAIQQLGSDNDFTVTATEDATQINSANLAQFEAVIFVHTTGDFLDAAQEAALQEYIQNGGGFVGVHAAADAEYGWPWYRQLVGAYFQQHPAIQQATVLVLERSHPSTNGLNERWVRTDEWYDFDANPRGSVHVLATLDEGTYSGGIMGEDHPIAWCQEFDGGRSWYTALGHTTESWSEPEFLAHLLGGIEWAAGEVGGDAGGTVWEKYEKVILDDNVNDPMALDVAPDGRVFFIERAGKLKVYSALTQATQVVGTLNVFNGLEDGLLGIALDPAFATNGWVYLYYSPAGATPENVLSRFTIESDALAPGSEVVLLHVATQRDECCHSGGGMEIGPNGDLYLSVGDNTNPFESDGFAPLDERPGRSAWDSQKSSSNTNDLRGKILRIHPESDGTYTIPGGNLFSPGTPQTRPEIFVMGARNPFRIAVDPFTGYLFWGEVGPDANNDSATRGPKGYDEVNQARTSGNYGWPYFVADNQAYRDYDFATATSGALFNPAAPTNDSPNNTGMLNLPAARDAFIWYPYGSSTEFPAIKDGNGRTMMAGAVYKYDANSGSDDAFPPYYDRTLFLMEWSRNDLYEVKMDANGDLLKIAEFAPTIPVSRPMDLTFGPDGAMYLIEWGDGFSGNNPDAKIVKIVYNSGNKTPVAVVSADVTGGPLPLMVQFSSAGSFDPDPDDTISFEWDFDLDGTIDSTSPNPTHTFTVPGIISTQLRVTDNHGKTGTASIEISAGNSRPVVTFLNPPDGALFDWGDEIEWSLRVDDAEDGSTSTGEILPEDVNVEVLLGHAGHAHNIAQFAALSGSAIALNSHAFEDDLFFALNGIYTDLGAPGVGPVTGNGVVALWPKVRQAEHYDTVSGITMVPTSDATGGGSDVASIDHGDYLSFWSMNLTNIQQIGLRVNSALSGGTVEVHADSPTGPLLATLSIPNTSGAANPYSDVFAPILDPGGVGDLYFVFLRNPGDVNLCLLNWIYFRGVGATSVAKRPFVTEIRAGLPVDSITVVFDEIMDRTSLESPANFSIGGTSISGATASGDQKSVQLTTTSPLIADQPYVLAVTNVKDLAGDPIAPATRVPFKTRSLVQAINSGGSAYTGVGGTNYQADQFFFGGNTFSTGTEITDTDDDTVYQTERYGNFSYSIPIANGTYWVALQFAEIFWTANGQRVFSVAAEGMPIVNNLDIFALVGQNRPYDLTFSVTITDGFLDLVFTTAVDNAKLSAIVITTSPVPFSDFASWQTFYFGSPSAPAADPYLDFEWDGLINYLEYAFGGDPTFGDAVYVSPTLGLTKGDPTKITLTYRKADPTLNYLGTSTTNLLDPESWSHDEVEDEVYYPVTDSYRQSVPIWPGEFFKFLRLEIRP